MLEPQLRVYMKPRAEAEGKKGSEGEGDGEEEARMLTGNGIDFCETTKPTPSDTALPTRPHFLIHFKQFHEL